MVAQHDETDRKIVGEIEGRPGKTTELFVPVGNLAVRVVYLCFTKGLSLRNGQSGVAEFGSAVERFVAPHDNPKCFGECVDI